MLEPVMTYRLSFTFWIVVAFSDAGVGPDGIAWRAETAIASVPNITIAARTVVLLLMVFTGTGYRPTCLHRKDAVTRRFRWLFLLDDPNRLFRDWILKHYSSLIAEALEEVHRSDALISFIVAASPDAETKEHVLAPPDAGFHSIDKRFDCVDHELGAIRRDVGLILAKLSST